MRVDSERQFMTPYIAIPPYVQACNGRIPSCTYTHIRRPAISHMRRRRDERHHYYPTVI